MAAKAKQNKHCIGLTMNAAEWHAAEISSAPGGIRVERTAQVEIPEGLWADGLVTDVAAAAALLKKLLSGFSKAPVVVGAKNQNVLMRMASFPKVPEDKVRGMVTYQAQKFIPLPIAELVLDYVPCGESQQDGETMMDVLLVGAKKTYLNQLITLMSAAGRELLDIDSALLANLRSVAEDKTAQKGTLLLVDIDQEMVSVMIAKEGVVRMARTVALSDMLEDILTEYFQSGNSNEQLAVQVAQMLAVEFRTSASYYSAQSGGTIDHAYLRTYFPRSERIAREISGILELPVTLPRPYDSIGQSDATFATCISLARKGLMEGQR